MGERKKEKLAKAVAPFAGAWIEISSAGNSYALIRSLPSRERGLKFTRLEHLQEGKESLPSRERGLKFCKYLLSCKDFSRSLRGSVD